MSSEQTAKEKIISLFLDGNGPVQMYKKLVKDGVKISRKEMNFLVHNYMLSLPPSIDSIDTSNMSNEQIDSLKSVIDGKLEIDKKIDKFEAMKKEASKLRQSMAKLYPEQIYAPELALINNCVMYVLEAGVPKYLIKKRFNTVLYNKISRSTKTKRVGGSSPPGVY